MLACEASVAPWLLIIRDEMEEIGPTLEMVAMVPLPEKFWVLMMAILIKLGVVVLAASMAPPTNGPLVTFGVENEELS